MQKIYEKIRLRPHDIDAIIDAFRMCFQKTDRLWIFGSRVDLSARGGDIDLYVECPDGNTERAAQSRRQFLVQLDQKLASKR